MPSNKRRPPSRRQSSIGPDDLSIPDILHLCGCRISGAHPDYDRLQTIDDLRDFWLGNRALMTTMMERFDEEQHLFKHAPGARTACEWVFELLPAGSRRQLDSDAGPDGATSLPGGLNGCIWCSRDGFESSVMYLERRGLLKPGEREAIGKYEAHRWSVRDALRRHRNTWNPHRHLSAIPPRDLALIAQLFDPRRQRELLTPAELAEAAPYLEQGL
jgi:hypothetical protein